MAENKIHIIYTRTEALLSLRRYESWREIQDEYAKYVASLGPWGGVEMEEFLEEEYPKLSPSAKEQIALLLASKDGVRRLTFAHAQGT